MPENTHDFNGTGPIFNPLIWKSTG